MLPLIKPSMLKRGDKIAAITLSWGGAAIFPYRFEVGKKRLEEIFGLEVVPTKHALKSAEWIYNNPKARADDLMDAFSDQNVKAIITMIGGDDSIRLLPFIDFDIIKNNPKVFMGFSDSTISHFMCLKAGLASFYGSSILTSFAENVSMHEYSTKSVHRTLFSNDIVGEIPENEEGWTKELLDWKDENNQKIKRKLNKNKGWNFIGNTSDTCNGRLIGGCMESMQFLNGTKLWPELNLWNESILFLETSETGNEPSHLLRFMRNFAAQGILQKLKGILFSKPGGQLITEQRFVEYDNAILKVFNEYEIPLIPIVSNMDFGHSEPRWIIPYGALAEINPVKQTVSISENTVF